VFRLVFGFLFRVGEAGVSRLFVSVVWGLVVSSFFRSWVLFAFWFGFRNFVCFVSGIARVFGSVSFVSGFAEHASVD